MHFFVLKLCFNSNIKFKIKLNSVIYLKIPIIFIYFINLIAFICDLFPPLPN